MKNYPQRMLSNNKNNNNFQNASDDTLNYQTIETHPAQKEYEN